MKVLFVAGFGPIVRDKGAKPETIPKIRCRFRSNGKKMATFIRKLWTG